MTNCRFQSAVRSFVICLLRVVVSLMLLYNAVMRYLLVNEEHIQHQLDYWFARPLGKALVATECRALERLLEHKFGHYLVQLGGPKKCNYLHSAIKNSIYLSPTVNELCSDTTIQAKYEELPFLQNSIDVFVAPHTLEFAHRPQKVLDEIYQALIPEGWAIFVGFNPISFWGLARLFANRKKAPWCADLITPYRLRNNQRIFG